MQPPTAYVLSEVADLLQPLGHEYHKKWTPTKFYDVFTLLDLLLALSDDTNVSFGMCAM